MRQLLPLALQQPDRREALQRSVDLAGGGRQPLDQRAPIERATRVAPVHPWG